MVAHDGKMWVVLLMYETKLQSSLMPTTNTNVLGSSPGPALRLHTQSLKFDGSTIVRLQFLDLPMATQISIEPLTSDDWEVIELNSELAESNILNQVRIVHESMTFPLWLHGRSAVKFKVVSTTPKTATGNATHAEY
ncbi:hypothetical protein ACFE04_012948 [Oxalis oulophora]